jgi:hypothetical protein
LTINAASTSTDVQTACGSYTWIDGNTYTSSNNTATFTLTNGSGCDSVVTLDLTINATSISTDVQTACGSYTWIDGNTYTSSNNTAIFTLTNGSGCDSVVTLDLTINNIDTTISQNGLTLTANQNGGTYQWVDCANGYLAVGGETASTFTPIVNGAYAVILNNGSCVDTSNCINVVVNNVTRVENDLKVQIYPNPTTGEVTIVTEPQLKNGMISIFTIDGQLLMQRNLEVEQYQLDLGSLPSAVYIIEINSNKGILHKKIIKR